MQQGKEKTQPIIWALWQAVVCKVDTFLFTARKCLQNIHLASPSLGKQNISYSVETRQLSLKADY